MTEYTLAQVIDKMGRNLGLKFQYIGEGIFEAESGSIIHVDTTGRVRNDVGELMLSSFTLNSKFRLVNEPVNFMEAIKAFAEEKIIYCEFEGDKSRYIPLEDDISHPLWDKNQNTITAEEILHGKWFIEGDD
ncbi:hypothetical protein [Clostridium luticellarii]|uniref:Uncharacterized protein n=1 Tax=Clostridium luticellarii TaxID=1691940 RepID=A0A2T0BQ44_9CLOT|nr:hypothetical protein [Clostridium luticellarii]PRR86004.1 hypothetical protein CLLU_10320 [Clostridium luticellarii]